MMTQVCKCENEEQKNNSVHVKKVLTKFHNIPCAPVPLLLLCSEFFLSNCNTMAPSLPTINQSLPPILALSSKTNSHARQKC